MMDPKKLLEKLDQIRREKPFRYLGRRVVQAMAEAATENPLVGQRSAPGRYLAIRVVQNQGEREQWEQLFGESRAAILRELEREAAAREIRLRSQPELDLVVVTDEEAARGESERILFGSVDEEEASAALDRLHAERELILPRQVRTLLLESDPPEAAVYLDHRQIGVTPCRVEEVPEGEHHLIFSRPGYLPYEDTLRVEPGRAAQKVTYRAALILEPPMGVLEVRTFPPRAHVVVGEEVRDSPARWRLPVGPLAVRVAMEDFKQEEVTVDLPSTSEERPYLLQIRLDYNGPDQDVIAGRLIIYRPGSSAPRRERDAVPNRISSFFRDTEGEEESAGWDLPPGSRPEEPQVLGERPLKRGVLLIGREDPRGGLAPDIRLFDPENTVSRGCHAWLWVYADKSTGATYNTFLIGNNSPAGIRVDGNLVMETRRLADDSEIEIGNFRMRLVKETPEARVEFGF
jgi:hypothetical protein